MPVPTWVDAERSPKCCLSWLCSSPCPGSQSTSTGYFWISYRRRPWGITARTCVTSIRFSSGSDTPIPPSTLFATASWARASRRPSVLSSDAAGTAPRPRATAECPSDGQWASAWVLAQPVTGRPDNVTRRPNIEDPAENVTGLSPPWTRSAWISRNLTRTGTRWIMCDPTSVTTWLIKVVTSVRTSWVMSNTRETQHRTGRKIMTSHA